MKRNRPISWLVAGLGAGAASMYFFDPDRGTRRRHIAADRARSALHDVSLLGGKAKRDLEHRVQGMSARAHGAHAGDRRRNLISEGTPERRLLELGGGGVLTLWGLVRGGLTGLAGTLGGAWLLARATFAPQRGRIRVQKTMTIEAPIEEVFAFWSKFENFPRFMNHVLEVKTDGNRSHWKVAGPAGVPIEWKAETTNVIPNKKIAWRSLDSAVIDHEGEIHFEREGEHATRINVHMTYDPPGGALGHAAAGFLLGDPKHLMDEDLLRLKSLFEEGRTRVHGFGVTRDDLARPR